MIIFCWIALLFPKLRKLPIILTYMPENLDSWKLLQMREFKKNWADENIPRMRKIVQIRYIFVTFIKKKSIIKANLKPSMILVLLWIKWLCGQYFFNMLAIKKIKKAFTFERVVIRSFEIWLFLISYTVQLEEKYTSPCIYRTNVIAWRQGLYLGITKYL